MIDPRARQQELEVIFVSLFFSAFFHVPNTTRFFFNFFFFFFFHLHLYLAFRIEYEGENSRFLEWNWKLSWRSVFFRFFFLSKCRCNFWRLVHRVPVARRVQSLNVALTMNLLAIFSSLVPDGEKAWLSGGFSARVFYVQRRWRR